MKSMHAAYHLLGVEESLSHLETTAQGLSPQEAQERLTKYGENKLSEGKKKSILLIFLEQFKNVMIWVLLAAALISLILKEVPDAIIIALVVLLNSVMGTIQEAKAEAALDALKEMAAPMAKVIRGGNVVELPAKDLVMGDVVLLEAGDNVPADLRLIESASLKIIEAALTGESAAVEKVIDAIEDENAVVGDRINMAYLGSAVSYGRGAGVVCATGSDTEMGKIADKLAETTKEETPLQRKMGEISKILSIGVVIIAAVIFGVGLLTGREVFEMFLLAVSLAVAAIPEGLATVVTVVLALGMKRMAKRGAIIRKLPAVETLGGTQVICSDKTGTLTQNRMTVEKIYVDDTLYEAADTSSSSVKMLACCMAICNDANLSEEGHAVGDPTETALMDYVLTQGLWDEHTLRTRERAGEIPFDSDRKLMSVIIEDDGYRNFVKGAPDILLSRCTKVTINNEIIPMDDTMRQNILDANKGLADDALRVLAFAYKDVASKDTSDVLATESDLTFIGLCGEMDPPRQEAADAVAACREAGITPVMITGDHRDTAVAIATRLGILGDGREAITGAEIEAMSDTELEQIVQHTGVYARVSPEHKVRIVDAWQRQGMVVAMTGDGVNDAPALKSADIGVGMGITGTDVSKGASDMVLTDDNFATIVKAVREGRKIFTNIKKAVKFLLSSNMGEVLALFIATLAGFSIFKPVHILWINLVTDTFPALALGVEKEEDDVMRHSPRNPKLPFFSKAMWREIVIHGAVEGLIALGIYLLGLKLYTPQVATTLAFVTLGLTQLFHALGGRFETRSFFSSPFSNKSMILAFAVSALLQVLVVIIPPIRNVFELAALGGIQWVMCVGASLLMLIYSEIEKAIKRAKHHTN